MLTELIIKTMLKHDRIFLKRCLIRIYSMQEEYEQKAERTLESNGVGFNQPDAGVLTTIARDMVLESVGSGLPPEHMIITPHAMEEVEKRMPKYVGQLMVLLTEEDLS